MTTTSGLRPPACATQRAAARRRTVEVIVEAVWKTTSWAPSNAIAQKRELGDIVAADELRRVAPCNFDRPLETIEALRLIGPDERLQHPRTLICRHVDRAQIDAAPPHHLDGALEQRRGRRQTVIAAKLELAAPPRARRVPVRVPVPEQVEPGRRAELEQVDRPAVDKREERRQERPGALHLVRLHFLLRAPAAQEDSVAFERRIERVPRRFAAERQVMQAAEQPERQVPLEIGCDAGDPKVAGKLAAYACVERRAAVAIDGLPLEDLPLPVATYLASAAFACWTISPNFAGSAIARSARILRSSSTFAAFRPAMNWLYDSPFARAPVDAHDQSSELAL